MFDSAYTYHGSASLMHLYGSGSVPWSIIMLLSCDFRCLYRCKHNHSVLTYRTTLFLYSNGSGWVYYSLNNGVGESVADVRINTHIGSTRIADSELCHVYFDP